MISPRVGHDIVHLPRFRELLESQLESFRRRVFTPGEWAAVSRRADRSAALAARFAAKEACMKALGTGWGRGVSWLDVEVVGGGRRAPSLRLHRAAAKHAAGLAFALSMTHDGDYACAFVVALPEAAGPETKAGARPSAGRPRAKRKG
jgi:holo-[acyl-carrier protein] synthase